MQLKFMSVMVQDQEKALRFYTEVLGFQKMADLPMGPARWLTVISPDGLAGVELVLEPMDFPPARDWQKALFDHGIPATAFITDDLARDVKRLKKAGVVFRGPPKAMGPISACIFEDGQGNLINLVQPHVLPDQQAGHDGKLKRQKAGLARARKAPKKPARRR